MKYKPLSQTNPYIKNPVARENLINRSVLTSSRVEGINISPIKNENEFSIDNFYSIEDLFKCLGVE